jgi:uncharacterized protein with GYD domain
MPHFLVQLSYKPETLAALVKRPQDRREVINKLAKEAGGSLLDTWMCLGKYDAVVILELPDSVSAAACAMAVSSSGAFTAFHTTPLFSMDESMEAMKRAGKIAYKPPSGKK